MVFYTKTDEDHEQDQEPSPSGLFLVATMIDEGLYESNFAVVRASSRLAVAQAMVDDPYRWGDLLRGAYLDEYAVRGNARYYEDERPPSAQELLDAIDRTYVDGDSRAKVVIFPVPEIREVA